MLNLNRRDRLVPSLLAMSTMLALSLATPAHATIIGSMGAVVGQGAPDYVNGLDHAQPLPMLDLEDNILVKYVFNDANPQKDFVPKWQLDSFPSERTVTNIGGGTSDSAEAFVFFAPVHVIQFDVGNAGSVLGGVGEFSISTSKQVYYGIDFDLAGGLTTINFISTDPTEVIYGGTFASYNGEGVTKSDWGVMGMFKGWTNYVSAVPEPSTWTLMIGGFGLAGVALRRRKRSLIEA
jgi:hypothetical protein